MVACGHTLGGVHGKDFPEITGNDSATNFVHFESDASSSFQKFDNVVVTEYLEGGVTSNLLVSGSNETMNSDARVFAADGTNATMRALADPDAFQAQCADILARMIDTVPAGVTLSEPLDAVKIKPYITSFALTNATHVTLTGRIRVLADIDSYADQAVHLTYIPRAAPAGNDTTALNTTIPTTRATFKLGTSSGLFGEIFAWHEFSAVLPAASSIAAFNVTVVRKSTGAAETFDNAGTGGYKLDDALLYLDGESCTSVPAGQDASSFERDVTIKAAVRKEVVAAGEKVAVEIVKKVARQGVAVAKLEVERWEEAEGAERVERGEWVVVQVKGRLEGDSLSTTFDVVVGEGEGEKRVEFQRTGGMMQQECKV